jgi:hypothetical protein
MSIPQRDQQPDKRREFLIAELRDLWLQLRQAQRDVEAIVGGLKCGAVNPDEAVGILCGVDLLALLGPASATEARRD